MNRDPTLDKFAPHQGKRKVAAAGCRRARPLRRHVPPLARRSAAVGARRAAHRSMLQCHNANVCVSVDFLA
ncbi:hypothetical protein DB771_26280 [Burkholderia sp. AU29985]|nr:hypothetical protein XM57_26155 [Burkholderia cepacia]AYZ95268.1 hypothetical protein EGY28_09665 [Burkholderia dolosa]ETP63748.1 hypothetical protein BDSB_20255 [Burkholderia dolosa PC543]PRE53354.1 hypothetical protein C6P87_07480 [Burkholderia sp. AU12872]PUA73816.1 hypothetical protein DB771_26280 [Burkholderia sp. AU29985]